MLAEAFGIEELDDASPMDDEGQIYLSSDMMFQSTDLPTNTHPIFWGHRFVASNLSDMAAMGCRPRSMMVSLGLPDDMKTLHFLKLLEGMRWACDEADIRIVGGDTNSAPEVVLSGFITGTPYDKPFTRFGARVGDGAFVTGSPGSAALGLALIKSRPKTYFDSPDILEEEIKGSAVPLGSFLAPEIRVTEVEDLSNMGVVTSCIDISDGISTDAGHIAESSGVRILIDESDLPFPSESRGIAKMLSLESLNLALNGGDDFELLFTAPQGSEESIRKAEIGIMIGEVVEGAGVAIRHNNGKVESLKSSGYQHFTGKGC